MRTTEQENLDLRGKRVLVLGLGLSGEAAAELLIAKGARVTAVDDRRDPGLEKKSGRLRRAGVRVLLGPAKRAIRLKDFDLMVVSPGVASGHRLIAAARREGTPVWGELELAGRFLDQSLIALTGTNGKSTAVTLISLMLNAGGIRCVPAGNLGVPLSRLALRSKTAAMIVAEVSSFQLETIDRFRPRIAVFIDFSPDHLDRYPGLDKYLKAKLNLFKNQGPGDSAVLAPGLPARVSRSIPTTVTRYAWGKSGGLVFVEDGWLMTENGGRRRICPLREIRLSGRHNLNNVLAACAVALLCGVRPDSMRKTIRRFEGLPHRLQYVGSRGGARFYNDSKATNPAAAVAALESFSSPVIWIAGGSDKGFDYRPLGARALRRVKLAVLLGEIRHKLRRALDRRIPSRLVKDLREAVAVAVGASRPGDVVLLAPAAASFDMFANYEQRGNLFMALAKKQGVKQ